MIVIPFGSGIVAAFIFLLFEILVLPLLYYTTTKIASLFLYWSGRKGNIVLVDPMRFPFWSDGLARQQLSHVFLLAVRIVFLAIPVYLETELISRDVPQMASRTLENAYIPEPFDDWVSYQIRSGENIIILRAKASNVFHSCTFTDEEGWVWAKVANITYLTYDRLRIQCVSDTEKLIYRHPKKDPLTYDRSVMAVRISLTEGRVKDFPKPLVDRNKLYALPGIEIYPNQTAYRIQSVTVLNDTAMHCFADNGVWALYGFRDGSSVRLGRVFGWCQKKEDTKIFGFHQFSFDIHELSETPLDDGSEREACGNSCQFSIRNGITVANISFSGSLEFKDKALLGAKHLANFIYPIGFTTLTDEVRNALYSKTKNVTVEVRSGSVKAKTEVEAKILIIGNVEVVVVLVCALVLACGWKWRWRHVQQPNTVNGLSKCWAQAEEDWSSQWISLSLDKSGSESESLSGFEPSRREVHKP